MSEDSSGLLVVRGRAGKETTVKFDVDDDYRLLQTIGTGAYGIVCSAIHKATGQKVAIKKISSPFDILTTAKRTLRELKLLLHFKHDNIVAVKNILYHESDDHKVKDVYVVMDLMESDLHHIIRSQQPLTENHICYFIYQLLRGLKYIHSANVIHRDLKPSNLLINENCELKIGDFGMARGVANSPEDNRNFMTEYVATRWYRAPELMLSMSEYSMAIDMWSVGCIFAEMIGRKQLFPGRHYVHQLQLIISVLGSPSTKLVNSIRSERVRSYVGSLPKKKAVPFKALYPKASDSVIDLLSSFLQFDPTCRESAESSLKHPFFREYHDGDDEPNCPTPFDFRFETLPADGAGPTKESVKKQVIDVIADYHSKLNRLKQQLVYLPKSANKTQFPETNMTNSAVQDSSINTSKPADQDVFKKPTVIPTTKSSVKSNKPKNQVLQPQPISSNVEMLSAKSDVSKLDQSEITESSSDVVMLSAKSSTTETKKDTDKINDHQPIVESSKSKATPGKLDANNNKAKKTISETTKMLVRDTILASMLAKKNGLTKPPEKPKKPVTAAERQREREEKRRKRQEKAAEKERKKKEAQGNKPSLSEQDKGLLERWSKMQAQAKKHNPPTVPAAQKVPLLSPNTLTRQNSLPSLITPNISAESNPEPITPRRWSLNSDVSYDFGNNFRYVPTLSDIPPSPMVANENQSYVQANQGQPNLSTNGNNVAKQNAAFSNIPNHVQNPVQQPQPQIVIQQFRTELNSQPPNSVPQFQNNGSLYPDASSVSQGMLQRPDTLRVADFQQTITSASQNSDSGMISSAKSLVNLSPDTVDFVLNHQIENPPTQSGNFERRTSTEDVLTLSPGKTSLIVKSIAAHNTQQKSASIEFSPQSFLLEMEKMTQKSDQYLTVDQTTNEGKLFDSQNGSVMLSESAVCNKNEMLYVNSNLTHNPLRQSSDGGGQTNSTFNQGMVGGYGIGYEPEVHGPVFDGENGGLVNMQNQQYEMECELAKSSSSLLTDWLDVSPMGEHDIEQLQRELELGSPMCIDTYNFKPD